MVHQSTVTNAGLQSLCTSPKGKGSVSSEFNDFEVGSIEKSVEKSGTISRFRTLNDEEQQRQAVDIEKIIHGLKSQQRLSTNRPRSAKLRSSQVSVNESFSKASNVDVRSPQTTYGRDSFGTKAKPKQLPAEHSSPEPVSMKTQPIRESFQERVLMEIQKLKKVQQEDFAAIQKLQKEKEQAERKVQELMQQLKLKEEKKKGKRVPSHEIVVENEDEGDQHYNPIVDHDEIGDESSPPPYYNESHDYIKKISLSKISETEDFPKKKNRARPQSAGATRVSRWSEHESDSPVFRKSSNKIKENPPKKISSPRPAFDGYLDHDSQDESQRSKEQQALERWRRNRRKSIDNSSATSKENKTLRQSAFFEEKQKAKAEAEWAAAQAALRLERAKHASPPANLLKRQEEARQKKDEQLRKLKEEMNRELAPEKRVKAREVPATTYISKESYNISEEQEQLRKERIMKRSTELMQSSKLPSRMALAATNDVQNEVFLLSARSAMSDGEMTTFGGAAAGVSLKMKKKLAVEAEEAAKRKALKPKPVPNFQQLHKKWEKLLKKKSQRDREKATVSQDFFVNNAEKYEELKARKLERKKKLEEEEAKKELKKKQDIERLIQKLRSQHSKTSDNSTAESTSGPKMTKATELRIKTIQKKLRDTEKAKEQEQIEDANRKQRQKEAAKKITNEVKVMEEKRKEDFKGEYKELHAVDDIAKERAKENQKRFQEAIARNKQNIMLAIATRPTLMERFATDVAKEEAKRSALETVVKNVFQKNFPVKGILTEEEQYLADEMNAIADQEEKKNDDED